MLPCTGSVLYESRIALTKEVSKLRLKKLG